MATARQRGPLRYATVSEVLEVADAAITVLEEIGVRCYAIGGLACHLLGGPRVPNNIDLAIMTNSREAEDLKAAMVKRAPDERFYLLEPRNPQATYKVLWCWSLLNTPVKVDLLIPPMLDLPRLSASDVWWIKGFPLAPFSLVLLHKLRGWSERRASKMAHYRAKTEMDAWDLRELVRLAGEEGLEIWEERFLQGKFWRESVERVREYVAAYPAEREAWFDLGMLDDPTEKKRLGV